MITPAQMDDVFGALSSADEDGDAQTLARICWQLYGELGEAHARAATLHARLADVAARAACAALSGEPLPPTPSAASRALMARGWPIAEIARRTGIEVAALECLLARRVATPEQVRMIALAYELLWDRLSPLNTPAQGKGTLR